MLSLLIPACSRPGLPTYEFVLSGMRQEKAAETGNTLEAAQLACEAEIRTKGTASVVNILSRFRSGAVETDYLPVWRGVAINPQSMKDRKPWQRTEAVRHEIGLSNRTPTLELSKNPDALGAVQLLFLAHRCHEFG